MASVELRNVNKVYPNGVEAVKDANLTIADGEFVVLVGPSGCGKSTTLRMIAGLEDLTSGEILIDERVVNRVPPKDRDIAMVFQNYALYPHMTVYKNLAFGLKIRKYPRKEIKERVEAAAQILGIEELLSRKPRARAGGQRQRVAVGRAIVRQPKVFLFDEPLSNLDAMLRVQMRAELGKLHTQLKTTMVYVTHDQVEAMTMGDRIVVMLDGVIQQVATPTELYQSPVNKFVAGFIGSPPMNFLDGEVFAENGHLHFKGIGDGMLLRVDPQHTDRLGEYVGQRIVLGIRPEDLSENATQEPIAGSSLTARVDVVEPLGAETFLYLSVGDRTLIARVRPDAAPAVDASHVLDVVMSKAHYFDPQTQQTVA